MVKDNENDENAVEPTEEMINDNDEDYDYDTVIENMENISITRKRKIAIKPIYLIFKKLDNRAEAIQFLESENYIKNDIERLHFQPMMIFL